MNAKQLNEDFSISYFLSLHNYNVVKIKGLNYWYRSMLQDSVERTPSFKVDTAINRWYDHSVGKGGKLIDLACLIFKTTNIKDVIRELNGSFSSFQQQKLEPVLREEVQRCGSSEKVKVVSVEELRHPMLIEYLSSRGIDHSIAQTYCKQVQYTNGAGRFTSVGFENLSGGFELRGKGFKSCTSPKEVSFIDNGFDKLAIFEGFTDFLSYQMLLDIQIEKSSWLILNSLSLLNKVTPILLNHSQLFLFLDNDAAGRSAVSKIAKLQLSQVDMSPVYADYKDLNEYLIKLNR